MSSITSRIAKLEKELNKLKVELEKQEYSESSDSSEKKEKKAKKIVDCTSKSQIEKFTVAELKDFIKKKKLDSKNASIKEDFVKIVFKYVKTLNKEEEEVSSSGSSSGEYEESEDEEEDEWEYYYY
jgi:hypothetical protein